MTGKRLTKEQWMTVWGNVSELMQDMALEGEDPSSERIEAIWLDPGDSSPGEWAIVSGCELLEDGFKDELAAERRLEEIEGWMY